MSRPRRDTFLSFSPTTMGEQEVEAVAEVIRSGWITTGPKTRAFEAAFKDFVGAEAALALSSWTTGAEIVLRALDIGPGDEVITTPMTFCATANIVEHLGATTVIADVEPDTLNLDPESVAARITSKTKAIIPVHYAGHPVNLDAFRALARDNDLHLFEDAAHSFPAAYKGQTIGASGSLAAYSFYATKNLATAEGGMVVGSEELVDRCRRLSLHGMSRDAWKRYDAGGTWRYDVPEPGWKANMTDIQAALGLVQLSRIRDFDARRRAIVARYQEAFGAYDCLQCPVERGDVQHAWHLYVLRVRPEMLTIDRDGLIEALKARNIGTSVHFIPLHEHSYYAKTYGWSGETVPVAHDNWQRILSLPLSPGLTDDDVDDVIDAVTSIIDEHRR